MFTVAMREEMLTETQLRSVMALKYKAIYTAGTAMENAIIMTIPVILPVPLTATQ